MAAPCVRWRDVVPPPGLCTTQFPLRGETNLRGPPSNLRLPVATALLTEDQVKRAVCDWLEARGWTVEVRWGRDRGIDIEARRSGERWVIEAKGEAPTDQMGGNYFLGALGELLQRMSEEGTRYAIALPETRRYRGLIDRLPILARRRLGLAVFWVRSGGEVRLEETAG